MLPVECESIAARDSLPSAAIPPYLLNNNDYLYLTVSPKNAAQRLIQGRPRHRAWLSNSTRLRLWQRPPLTYLYSGSRDVGICSGCKS